MKSLLSHNLCCSFLFQFEIQTLQLVLYYFSLSQYTGLFAFCKAVVSNFLQ